MIRIRGEIHSQRNEGRVAPGSKDLVGDERGLGGHTRADLEIIGVDARTVRTGEGAVVRQDSQARGNPGYVRTVSVGSGVQWIGVWFRSRTAELPAGIVVVAGKIPPTDHLGGREGSGLDDRGIIGRVFRRVAGAAEVGVQIVDARIHDGDAHAPTRDSGLGPLG